LIWRADAIEDGPMMRHTSSLAFVRRCSRAGALFVFACAALTGPLTAACASDDGAEKKAPSVGKHRFAPADYNLDFLEVDKTAERLSPMVVDKIRAVLDHIEKKLPTLLAAIPPPVPQIVQIAVAKGKPILETKLEQKLTAMIQENRERVDPIVQRYNVFKDPELSYDLIEDASDDTKSTIDRVNASIKDAYRTVRAVRVARKMLAVAKTDLAELPPVKKEAAPNPAALAGVGVAALSITELSLEAIDDAHTLLPELKQLGGDLTNQVAGNPLLAVKLSGAIGAVSGAIADLTTVPKDAADLLGEASDLLALFDGA
jgi:hypothetical protein